MPQPNPYESPQTESDSTAETTDDSEKRFDSFASWALGLSLLDLFCPVVPDVFTTGMIPNQEIGAALFVLAIQFVVVTTPAVISWRRQLTQPGVWRGRGVLIAATVILTLLAVRAAFMMFNVVFW